MFKNIILSAQRLYIQIAAVVITNSYFLAPYLKYLPCPSLNCYACPIANFACPIGSLQHFVIIGVFPFFLLGILFLVGGLIGRWSCGYLCPFGLFQDLLAKIKNVKLDMPSWLGWGRYVSLVGVAIIIPAITKEPWFSKLCPAGTLEAGIPIVGWAFFKTKALGQYSPILGMTGWLFWVKIVLLGGTIVAALYIKRPFCRFICPLGAIFGIFNRISLVQIEVDKNKVSPRVDYSKICPVDINICDDPVSAKCIRCMQCTKCPGVTRK
ncbi:MAG: 4Fe-4S binding protein [bacterium]|nr:4Fe-4S binding protein [bacterium]